MPPRRLLLTAFEPFDETGLNASAEAARAFAAEWGARWGLERLLLPVRYDEDTALVAAAVAELSPAAILHTGQTHRSRVAVERLAVNVRTLPHDLPTVRRHDCPQLPILPDGPAAYFATAPVEEMAAAIGAAGVPVEVSNHAGIYLCNHVLYQSLHRAACPAGVPGHAARIAFLHLPTLPEQRAAGSESPGSPSLSLDQLVAAIHAAVEVLLADLPP